MSSDSGRKKKETGYPETNVASSVGEGSRSETLSWMPKEYNPEKMEGHVYRPASPDWKQKRTHVYNPPYPEGFVYELTSPDYSLLFSEGSDQRNSSPVRLVRCDDCGDEHPDLSDTFCPKKLCTTCFTPGHDPVRCPFLQHIPNGANYDRVQYHVVCECGGLCFDEEKWFCSVCRGLGTTRLKLKLCAICYTFAQHCTEECPNDKIAAAEHRATRDYIRSHPPKKYVVAAAQRPTRA